MDGDHSAVEPDGRGLVDDQRGWAGGVQQGAQPFLVFAAEKLEKTGGQQVFFPQAAQGKGGGVGMKDRAVQCEFHYPFGHAVKDNFIMSSGKQQLRGDMPLVQVFSAEDLAFQFLKGAVVDMLDDLDDMFFGVFKWSLGDAGIGSEVENIGFILKHRGRVNDDRELFQFSPAADNLAELFPVDVGHDQVGKNNVRPCRLENLQGCKPVFRREHLVALFFQETHQQFQGDRVVVHYQNRFHGILVSSIRKGCTPGSKALL